MQEVGVFGCAQTESTVQPRGVAAAMRVQGGGRRLQAQTWHWKSQKWKPLTCSDGS